MKVWKGIELEGSMKGKMTMFAKGEVIEGLIVVDLLDQNPDCKRLYLGAGRVDTLQIQDLQLLASYCACNEIMVTHETSLANLAKVTDTILTEADETIVRIFDTNFDKLSSLDTIKIDSGKHVFTADLMEMVHTDLSTLNVDMFKDVDVLLYEN